MAVGPRAAKVGKADSDEDPVTQEYKRILLAAMERAKANGDLNLAKHLLEWAASPSVKASDLAKQRKKAAAHGDYELAEALTALYMSFIEGGPSGAAAGRSSDKKTVAMTTAIEVFQGYEGEDASPKMSLNEEDIEEMLKDGFDADFVDDIMEECEAQEEDALLPPARACGGSRSTSKEDPGQGSCRCCLSRGWGCLLSLGTLLLLACGLVAYLAYSGFLPDPGAAPHKGTAHPGAAPGAADGTQAAALRAPMQAPGTGAEPDDAASVPKPPPPPAPSPLQAGGRRPAAAVKAAFFLKHAAGLGCSEPRELGRLGQTLVNSVERCQADCRMRADCAAYLVDTNTGPRPCVLYSGKASIFATPMAFEVAEKHSARCFTGSTGKQPALPDVGKVSATWVANLVVGQWHEGGCPEGASPLTLAACQRAAKALGRTFDQKPATESAGSPVGCHLFGHFDVRHNPGPMGWGSWDARPLCTQRMEALPKAQPPEPRYVRSEAVEMNRITQDLGSGGIFIMGNSVDRVALEDFCALAEGKYQTLLAEHCEKCRLGDITIMRCTMAGVDEPPYWPGVPDLASDMKLLKAKQMRTEDQINAWSRKIVRHLNNKTPLLVVVNSALWDLERFWMLRGMPPKGMVVDGDDLAYWCRMSVPTALAWVKGAFPESQVAVQIPPTIARSGQGRSPFALDAMANCLRQQLSRSSYALIDYHRIVGDYIQLSSMSSDVFRDRVLPASGPSLAYMDRVLTAAAQARKRRSP